MPPTPGRRTRHHVLDIVTATITFTLGLVVLAPHLLPASWLSAFPAVGNQALRLLLGPVLLLDGLHHARSASWRRVAFVACLLLVLALEIVFTIPLRPDPLPAVPGGLRVMTVNAQAQSEYAWMHPMRVHEVDLGCVQEMNERETAKTRHTLAKVGFDHSHFGQDADGIDRIGLVSKLPFLSTDTVLVPTLHGGEKAFPLGQLLWQEDTLTVMGVHLEHVPRSHPLDLATFRAAGAVRAAQIARVLASVESAPGPVLLLGDFNATPTDPDLAAVRDRFADAWVQAGAGYGGTWVDELPVMRVDYVFLRGLRAHDPRLVPVSRGDHLALAVQVSHDPQ